MAEGMRYNHRGVSADKAEVHAAVKHLDKGLYPNAFCKILPDVVGNDPNFCNLMHADTAGTKTSLAYLYWKETGELSVWAGIAQDAIVMNLDDMACVGCTDHIILSSTIGRNKHLIPAAVLQTLIGATSDFKEKMGQYGIHIHLAGGETADVGDIVRTIDVGYTAFARMPRKEVLENHIQPGDVLVAFSSFGQAVYEDTYNGGMGSNGLTSARHDVLCRDYAGLYPESYDPNTNASYIYGGNRRLTDPVSIQGHNIDVGKLLLSPTRTYMPLIVALFKALRPHINGMIHCTGGGQTKVLKFAPRLRVVKDNLFPVPPLFKLIQEESGTEWKEMYQVFNMGHRLEVYLPAPYAEQAVELAAQFGIEARIAGYVEASENAEVCLKTPFGEFAYS
jgi:phosphoribosylformylglycinamidine cyclo-ligase